MYGPQTAQIITPVACKIGDNPLAYVGLQRYHDVDQHEYDERFVVITMQFISFFQVFFHKVQQLPI